MKRLAIAIAFVLFSCNPEVGELADATPLPPKVEFAKDIRPLIAKRCKGCHYSTEAKHTGTDESGFDMATLASLRQGGFHTGNGVVIPGNPNASAIVRKLRGTFDVGDRMPKNAPPYLSAEPKYLSEEQIRVVELWIEQGAEGEPDE